MRCLGRGLLDRPDCCVKRSSHVDLAICPQWVVRRQAEAHTARNQMPDNKPLRPNLGRANGDVCVHAPRRVSPVRVRRTCLETPVPIEFQDNCVVWIPSIFAARCRAALVASVSAVASGSPTARWRVAARDGRGERDGASYLTNPSAFSVSCTAGRAPTLAMKPLMFGHLPRSILCMPVQLSTVNR